MSAVLPIVNFAGTQPTQHASAVVRPDGRILIWTGASGFGAHAVEEYLTCPHRFALRQLDKPRGPGHPMPVADLALLRSLLCAEPRKDTYYMRRGTLVHVALSHHYAQAGARQGGVVVDGVLYTDPEVFYAPLEAMDLYAAGSGDEGKVLAEARAAFLRYVEWARPYDAGLRFLGVETVAEVEVPGGFRHTARFDLVTENALGRVQVHDHKTLSQPENAHEDYRFSLQILGQKAIGLHKWGSRFDGVFINAVSAVKEKACERNLVPTAGLIERDTLRIIGRARSEIQAKTGLPPSAWPRVPSSHCRNCPVQTRCVFG